MNDAEFGQSKDQQLKPAHRVLTMIAFYEAEVDMQIAENRMERLSLLAKEIHGRQGANDRIQQE